MAMQIDFSALLPGASLTGTGRMRRGTDESIADIAIPAAR